MARAKGRRRPRPRLTGQLVGLLLGIYPIFLVMALSTQGGAGLHKGMLASWCLAMLGLFASLAYHLWYRREHPRSTLAPPNAWKTLVVASLVFVFGLLNLWGATTGWALQLTPNQMENPQRWLQLAANLALGQTPQIPVGGTGIEAQYHPWVLGPAMLGGALWGALGYAAVFGWGGFLSSSVRKEVFDWRQEPFGSVAFWPVLRPLIGYYYGWGLGFGFGSLLITILLLLSPGSRDLPPSVTALRDALGAVPDPNRAFTMGLVSGAWILAGGMLFLGRGDFTATFSDPKPAEREPPMTVDIPALPKIERPELDFAALVAETEQIATSFGRDLQGLVRQIGLTEAPPPAFSPPEAPSETTGGETTMVNLLSARKPDFDLAFDQALGQLSSVYVQISGLLGHLEVSLADWLTLEEGSLLEMPRSPDGTIALCLNGRAVGRAKPAAYENHVAVKVVKLDPGTVEALKG
ncbi:MAG: FliM/FliN family flagellar motor switch protein [Cyanobacteria bacterium REEB65]|nr:FliM/FliN family flagellar motor switch protein [Cyanobacteria bacterium REEB65]